MAAIARNQFITNFINAMPNPLTDGIVSDMRIFYANPLTFSE